MTFELPALGLPRIDSQLFWNPTGFFQKYFPEFSPLIRKARYTLDFSENRIVDGIAEKMEFSSSILDDEDRQA